MEGSMWRRWSMGVAAAMAGAAAAALPVELGRFETSPAAAPTEITLAFDDGVSLRVEHGDLIVTFRL
jgi:hypothetical protein